MAGFCDVEQRLCLGAGAVERPRPDPQGADVRPHRRAGQPRRGRQGVLVVPRRRAEPRLEPLALPLPAARLPVRRPDRRERPARQARPRVRAARHGRLRRRPLLDRRGRLRQGRSDRPADDGAGHQRRTATPTRCTCCRRCGSATRGRGTTTRDKPACAPAPTATVAHRPPVPRRARARWPAPAPDGTAPELLFCENETNTRRGSTASAGATPYPQGRDQRPRRRRRADTVNPDGRGTKAALLVPARGRRRAPPWRCACGCGRRARQPTSRRGARRRVRRGRRRQRQAEADEFYARADPGRRHAPTRPSSCARPSPGCCGASSSTPTTSRRWLDGDPDPAAPPPASRLPAATAGGATSRPSTSCRCPTSGSTRGSRRGTSAFHCVALAHVDPAFAKYQLHRCCAGSGSSTRTAPCPPTSGTSATSTRRCRRGPRSRCSPSTAARDLDFLSRIFDKLLVNFTWWVNREDATAPTCSRAASSASTTSGRIDRSHLPGRRHASSSPTPPAGWRSTPWRWARIAAHPQPVRRSARPTDLVIKFLEHFAAIRRSHGRPRRVGRDRRPLLRQAGHARRHRGAGQGAVDGRHHPAARRGRRSTRTSSTRPETRRQAVRRLLDVDGLGSRERAHRAGPAPRRRRQRNGCCSASSASTTCSGCSTKLFDEDEFLSPYGLRAISAYHREHPYELEVEGITRHDRLRAGRVDHGDVRRQLQLARARSGSRSTTSSSAPSTATTGSSATTSRSSTPPAAASS